MCWGLIIEQFSPNIQNIYGVENIIADVLSRIRTDTNKQSDTNTHGSLSRAGGLFATGLRKRQYVFPFEPLKIQQEQNKELKF